MWVMEPGDTTASPSRINRQCKSVAVDPVPGLRENAVNDPCCPTCGCWCIATLAYLNPLGSCQAGICWEASAWHLSGAPAAVNGAPADPGACVGSTYGPVGVRTSQNSALCVGTTVNVTFTLQPTNGFVLYYSGPDVFGFPCVVYANVAYQGLTVPPHAVPQCCNGTDPCFTNMTVPGGNQNGPLQCNDGSACFFIGGCADGSCHLTACGDFVMSPFAPNVVNGGNAHC